MHEMMSNISALLAPMTSDAVWTVYQIVSLILLACMAIGAIVAIVTYFLFAIVAGSISFGWMNLFDVLFGAAAGGISALIAAAAKNRM